MHQPFNISARLELCNTIFPTTCISLLTYLPGWNYVMLSFRQHASAFDVSARLELCNTIFPTTCISLLTYLQQMIFENIAKQIVMSNPFCCFNIPDLTIVLLTFIHIFYCPNSVFSKTSTEPVL